MCVLSSCEHASHCPVWKLSVAVPRQASSPKELPSHTHAKQTAGDGWWWKWRNTERPVPSGWENSEAHMSLALRGLQWDKAPALTLVTGFMGIHYWRFSLSYFLTPPWVFLAITSHIMHGTFLGQPSSKQFSRTYSPSHMEDNLLGSLHACLSGSFLPLPSLTPLFLFSRDHVPSCSQLLSLPYFFLTNKICFFSVRYWGDSNPIKANQPQTWMIHSFSLCQINLYFKRAYLLPKWISSECWIRDSIETNTFRPCGVYNSQGNWGRWQKFLAEVGQAITQDITWSGLSKTIGLNQIAKQG